MIGSVIDVLFGCRHRRTTFPLTAARKTAEGPVETYVVCLDCGKQFLYDWENMRLAGPADISADSNELHPEAERVPFQTKSKARYVLLASALPAAWLIRGVIKSRKKPRAAGSASQDGHDNQDQNT